MHVCFYVSRKLTNIDGIGHKCGTWSERLKMRLIEFYHKICANEIAAKG